MGNVDWALTWATVQAVSAAVTAVVIVMTALFAMRQLGEMTRSRYAQVLDMIHEILADPAVVAARRAVRELPEGFELDSLSEEQRAKIELVTRSFDRAGFYLWLKLVPEKYVLPEWPGALGHWKKLKEYVCRQRRDEGYEARRFFEYMAEKTEEFRKKRRLPV